MRTGQIIAKLRNEASMSQQQLADVLFVSRDLISKWETGRRLPDYHYIEIMADLFSVDPEELVTRDSILYKNAVFDTNRKSLLRHISAEKGLK